jgi:hypothetical protein
VKQLLLVVLVALAPAAMANLVDMSLDSQINIGQGDAIIAQAGGTISFPSDEGSDMGVQMTMAGNGYYYGPRIYFVRAGYSALDLSASEATLSIDLKAFQGGGNPTPFGDCNIFVRLYSGTADLPSTYRDFGLLYGPNATVWPFGDWANWNRLNLNINGATHSDSAGFDITAVTQMRLYGTDWAGTGQDWIAAKDLAITPEPATLALLGLAALLRRR